jgi:hypothetical protein
MSEPMAPTAATAGLSAGELTAPSRARRLDLAGWRREWAPAIKAAVASFVVFKVATEVIALIAVYGAAFPREVFRHPSLAYSFWGQWDGGWYLGLATNGYAQLEHVLIPPGRYQDGVAFAPALPIMVRLTYRALHLNPLLAGLLVVSVCLLVALVGLYKLVEMDFGRGVASTTLILLLVFPSAFFFTAVYAEAIVLMGAVWAVLMVRQDRLALAGIFAAVAIMAKVAAGIVVVLMLIEYWELHRSHLRSRWWRLGWLATPVVVLGAWSAYLEVRFHNPLAFLTAHQEWDHHFAPIWVPIASSLQQLFNLSMFDQPHGIISLLDLLSVGVMAAAAVYLYLRVRRSYGIYCALGLIIITSTGLLDSTYRHLLMVFPVFIAGAVLVQRRPWLERTLLVICAPLLAYALSRFVITQWAG